MGSCGFLLLGGVLASVLLTPRKAAMPERIQDGMKRVDERDVIFSRRRYIPGTDIYDRYYSEHPDRKATDDEIRKLPELFSPGGTLYDKELAALGRVKFQSLEGLAHLVDGPVGPNRVSLDEKVAAARLKGMVLSLGACSAGISLLHPAAVYSYVGRGPEEWGKAIDLPHSHAISFTVEMDYETIRGAPHMATAVETAERYLQAALISIEIARFIRSLGYSARAHIEGSNYQAVLPPLAQEAGLGEIGRIGILMTERLGPRVRLGLVTTDLPLKTDPLQPFGASEFCERCLKCAKACPAGAIPQGERTLSNGVRRWTMNAEACYRTWRTLGTDCALCLSACPYSKPDAFPHNVVRAAIKRSRLARRAALWADDLFYGMPDAASITMRKESDKSAS